MLTQAGFQSVQRIYLKSRKNSVVLPGLHQSKSLHLLAFAINQSLGSIGTCLNYLPVPKRSSYSFADLSTDVDNGLVKSIIVLGGNPIFNCPNSGLGKLLGKIENSVHLGHAIDETSQLCQHHIGQSHFLESWDIGLYLGSILHCSHPTSDCASL